MHYDTFSNLMNQFSDEEMKHRAAEEKARHRAKLRKRIAHALLGVLLLGVCYGGFHYRKEIKVQMDKVTGINEPRQASKSEEHANAVVKGANEEAKKRANAIEDMFGK
jgi:ferric-dicitrate binding protein FerR (iron transport regulator)